MVALADEDVDQWYYNKGTTDKKEWVKFNTIPRVNFPDDPVANKLIEDAF